MRATDGTKSVSLIDDTMYGIVARALAIATCVVFAMATFLMARRVTGAFSSPLSLLPLTATATVVVLWTLVVRELSARKPAFEAASIVTLFTIALACSYPGTRPVDWLIWPAAMLAVVFCPSLAWKREQQRKRLRVSHPATETVGPTESDCETILQQFTRVRSAEGIESIHGIFMAEFAAGERQTLTHIAFCPPFERLPQVEANVADDSDAEVKLIQVLHNGSQFEVRLPQPADTPTNVAVEFFAAGAI